MKKSTEDYVTIGLIALKRAASKALEKAKQNNLQVPIWKDGKIEYITSEIDTEQLCMIKCISKYSGPKRNKYQPS